MASESIDLHNARTHYGILMGVQFCKSTMWNGKIHILIIFHQEYCSENLWIIQVWPLLCNCSWWSVRSGGDWEFGWWLYISDRYVDCHRDAATPSLILKRAIAQACHILRSKLVRNNMSWQPPRQKANIFCCCQCRTEWISTVDCRDCTVDCIVAWTVAQCTAGGEQIQHSQSAVRCIAVTSWI